MHIISKLVGPCHMGHEIIEFIVKNYVVFLTLIVFILKLCDLHLTDLNCYQRFLPVASLKVYFDTSAKFLVQQYSNSDYKFCGP